MREVFDVEHAVYHSVDPAGQPYALATYGPDWAKHYECDKLYLIDPVVRAAFSAFSPYDWRHLDWSGKRLQNFRHEAIEGGVGNQGLSVPIRGPNGEFALVTVSTRAREDQWHRQTKDMREKVLMTGYYLHAANRALLDREQEHQKAYLSPRERDVLVLLSVGIHRSGIADRLKISEHTVRVYIDTARRKLGARNTVHAITMALKSGLISL